MKLPAIIILFLFIISCSSNQPPNKKNTGVLNVVAKPDNEKDSLYKIGDFLVPGVANMKLELIKKGEHHLKSVTKGDTLYNDSLYTILGNKKELTGWGVYKKFSCKSDFANYKVEGVYKGRMAMPNLNSNPDARHWRTRLKEGCKDDSVNFAGHYTIVEWGCGTMCAQMGVVDRVTGNVYLDFPFQESDGYWGCDFRSDSKMLIINTALTTEYEGYCLQDFYLKPEVYVWTGNNF